MIVVVSIYIKNHESQRLLTISAEFSIKGSDYNRFFFYKYFDFLIVTIIGDFFFVSVESGI